MLSLFYFIQKCVGLWHFSQPHTSLETGSSGLDLIKLAIPVLEVVGQVLYTCQYLSVSLSVSYSSLSEYRRLLLLPGGKSTLQKVSTGRLKDFQGRERMNVPPPPPLLLPILDGHYCRELRLGDIDVWTCQGCPLPRPSNWIQAPATHLVKLLERGPTKSIHTQKCQHGRRDLNV